MNDAIKPISRADIEWAIRRITRRLARKFEGRFKDGWSDATLRSELELSWSVEGGCYIPGKPAIQYKAAGLKVWVTWEVNTYGVPPNFEGQSTIALVREIYGIPDPDNHQMRLL